MGVVGIDDDESFSKALGFPLAVVEDLGREDAVAAGEDIVEGEGGLFGGGVIDPVDDDGVDLVIVEVVVEGGLVEDAAVEVSFAADLLFTEEDGDGTAGDDGRGEGAIFENGAVVFAKIADGDGEFGGGGIFDAGDGEVFFEVVDGAFAAEEAEGFAEKHGKPAVEEAGVEEGLF